MTRDDELEFSISQYLDGTLAGAERDALDERLARDADARAVLAEYQSFQAVLASSPIPNVKWDRLAAEISASVAREPMPAQSYKLSQWLRPARLALAASVLVAVGFAAVFLSDRGGSTNPAPQKISIVKVDQPDTDVVSPVGNTSGIIVAVGPPAPSSPDERFVLHIDDDGGIVQRPSKALIVSAAPTVQDTLLTPF